MTEPRWQGARPRLGVIGAGPSDEAVLRSIAATYRFEAHVVAGSPEGIATLVACAPDVVVLELTSQLTGRIRAYDELASVPLIAMSTLDEEVTRWRAFDLGFDEVVAKPFNRHSLGCRIYSLARLRRAGARRRPGLAQEQPAPT